MSDMKKAIQEVNAKGYNDKVYGGMWFGKLASEEFVLLTSDAIVAFLTTLKRESDLARGYVDFNDYSAILKEESSFQGARFVYVANNDYGASLIIASKLRWSDISEKIKQIIKLGQF